MDADDQDDHPTCHRWHLSDARPALALWGATSARHACESAALVVDGPAWSSALLAETVGRVAEAKTVLRSSISVLSRRSTSNSVRIDEARLVETVQRSWPVDTESIVV